jgi:hypothetical protein
MRSVHTGSVTAAPERGHVEAPHHLRLLELHDAAAFGRSGPARVAACRRELRLAIPVLTAHVGAEESALRSPLLAGSSLVAERRIATNLSQLRELRAVLDAADRLIEEDGECDSVVLEALCRYVSACALDWIQREACGCPVDRVAA